MKKALVITPLAITLAATLSLQAQVSDNWNDGDDTTGQTWSHYAPGALGQTFTFPANPADSTPAYRLTSFTGTTPNPGRVGSFLMGTPGIADFTITCDLINWDNTKSMNMGIMARVQSPLPAATFPLGYALVYTDRASAGAGGTDQLRLYKVVSGGLGFMNTTTGGPQTNGNLGQFGTAVGGSASPNPTNDYQLVFSGFGNLFTGQIIDKSTGLALMFNDGFGGLTNTLWASDPGAAGFGASGATLYSSGQYGLFGFVGSGALDPAGSINTDFTMDNFSIIAIPEPSTVAFIITGSVVALRVSYRKRQRA